MTGLSSESPETLAPGRPLSVLTKDLSHVEGNQMLQIILSI